MKSIRIFDAIINEINPIWIHPNKLIILSSRAIVYGKSDETIITNVISLTMSLISSNF